MPEGHPLVTSKHLLNYGIKFNDTNNISEKDFVEINKRSLVEPYDILLSMIGTVGLISYVMYDKINFAIKNVGLFKTSKNELLREFILLHLKSDTITNYIETHQAGSTQSYISLKELRKIPVCIPPKTILLEFKEITTPILNQIKINYKEIETLTKLRDTLLPKLMSGEIDVSEINFDLRGDKT